MDKRKRNVNMFFRVTEAERELILEKMALSGINNMSAYLRKMAIDGYVVKLDLSEVNDMVSLQRNTTNNLNQIARRVNGTGSLYKTDIQDLQENYDKLWQQMGQVLHQLSAL